MSDNSAELPIYSSHGYDLPHTYYSPDPHPREKGMAILTNVVGERVEIPVPYKRDDTKEWFPEHTSPNKDVQQRGYEAQVFYNLILSYNSEDPNHYKEAAREITDEYFKSLDNLGLKATLYYLEFRGVKIYYSVLSKKPINEINGVPPGLLSTIQSAVYLSKKLDISLPNKNLFVFDMFDLQNNEPASNTTNNNGMEDNNLKSISGNEFNLWGINGGNSVFYTHAGQLEKNSQDRSLLYVKADPKYKSPQMMRHEISHFLGQMFEGSNAPTAALEGWATMCQYDFDPIKCLSDYYTDDKPFSWDKFITIFKEGEESKIRKVDKYNASGCMYAVIYQEYGAIALRKFHALVTGNYGNSLSKYSPNCKGDVEKALLEIAKMKNEDDISRVKNRFVEIMESFEGADKWSK